MMNTNLEVLTFNFSNPSPEDIDKAEECFRSFGVVVFKAALDEAKVNAVGDISNQLIEYLEDLSDTERRSLPRCYNAHSANISPSLIALNDWLLRAGADEYVILEMIENSHISPMLKRVLGERLVCTLFQSRLRLQRSKSPTEN